MNDWTIQKWYRSRQMAVCALHLARLAFKMIFSSFFSYSAICSATFLRLADFRLVTPLHYIHRANASVRLFVPKKVTAATVTTSTTAKIVHNENKTNWFHFYLVYVLANRGFGCGHSSVDYTRLPMIQWNFILKWANNNPKTHQQMIVQKAILCFVQTAN